MADQGQVTQTHQMHTCTLTAKIRLISVVTFMQTLDVANHYQTVQEI